MTYEERFRLAVLRELTIITEATNRLTKLIDDDKELDRKIADADKLTGRVKPYPKPVEDMTADEIARHFGGA